jgi:hypothetical protein
MLGLSPQLETCGFQINDGPSPTTPQAIHMQRLCELCIHDYTRDHTTRLFHCIEFPNLEEFDYSSGRAPFPILACLTASAKLTSLGLDTPMSTKTITEYLRMFPKPETLALYQPRGQSRVETCQLFSLLTPTTPNLSATICPHLQQLFCFGIAVGSDPELLALVLARRASGQSLLWEASFVSP